MKNKLLKLNIERLAGLGDGMAMHEGRKVFVPFTVAGDVVEAAMVRRTTDADYAALERVITPGEARCEPVCRHFGECGGCSLQQLARPAYESFKLEMARAAVRKAGYDSGLVAPLVAFGTGTRRRVELKAAGGTLGYFSARSHSLVPISACPVLEPELEALVMRLKGYCAPLAGLRSVQVNGLDEGYDVLLETETPPVWPHSDEAIRRVSSHWGGQVALIHQFGPVSITFGGVAVEPPAGAFLQAVRGAQEAITKRVLKACSDAHTVLDLFCGLGTYSLPLAVESRVQAVEGDAALVQALKAAAARAGLGERLQARRRDLFKDPMKPRELALHDAVVINPPRTGALAQCRELSETRIPSLVMISCNPATFARDARVLNDGGYTLQKATPVDQFTYSPHLEIIAEFTI